MNNIKIKRLNFCKAHSLSYGEYLLAESPVGDYGIFKQTNKNRYDYGKYTLVKWGNRGMEDVVFTERNIDSEEDAIESANYWFRQAVMNCIDFE